MTSRTARRPRLRWILPSLAAILLLLFIAPVLEVLLVRFWDPPITSLMLVRRLEGIFSARYHGDIHYHWIPLRSVPTTFLDAVWQMEDDRFFLHDGFDWIAIEEAIQEARLKNRPVRGVSTISMQCARSLFLWTGRSWVRKAVEAYYTFLMEHLLDKKRILELYVNVVELGDGIYGIEMAARRYYERPAVQLTRNQSAMLAAMLPYPRGWNPRAPSPRLKMRYAQALRRMNDGGPIQNQLERSGRQR